MNPPIITTATLRVAGMITLGLVSVFLVACQSDKPKKIKSAEELGDDAVSHRIFYEGWRHPDSHPDQDRFFYGSR